MANCWLYSPLILLSLSIHTSMAIEAAPSSSAAVAGVFLLPADGRYVFNATAARGACRRRNATLATEAQMDAAQQLGLQTCKYGWMEGPVAVIPRNTPDPKCGKGKVGLATWNTVASKLFGAFCFKAEGVHTTTAIPVNVKPTAFTTRRRHVYATTRVPRHTSRAPPSTEPRRNPWSGPPPRTSSSSSTSSSHTAAAPRAMTSPTSTRKSKSSPQTPVGASSLSSVPLHPFPSSPATTTTTTSSTSTTLPTENVVLPHSSNSSMGALPVALIVAGLIVLVLTAAAAVWYCKRPQGLFPPPWSRTPQPSDEVEAEMWKKTDSDTDLHSQLAMEDKTDSKNASEVTLCINSPDTKTQAVV